MDRESEVGVWAPVIPFLAANVLFGAGLFAHAFLYNFYLDSLGFEEGLMGAAAAALTGGGLIALAPAGALLDRWGHPTTYAVAGMMACAGLAWGGLAESPATILVAAMMAGAGTATWRVAMGPFLMAIAPPAIRSKAFSWNVAVLLASGSIWTATAGALPRWWSELTGGSEFAGMRVALVACSLGALVSGMLVLARSGPTGRHPGRPGRRSLSEAVRGLAVPSRIRLLTLLVLVWMLGGGMVIPFLNIYFLRVHGLPVEGIGVIFGVVHALTALVVIGGGELAQRFGPRRAFGGWALLFPVALVGLAFAGSVVPAVALFAVQGLVPPATNPLLDELLLDEADPSAHGAVSSWRNAATELSGLLGSGAGGLILQAGSFLSLFSVAAVLAGVGGTALVRSLRRTRETDAA